MSSVTWFYDQISPKMNMELFYLLWQYNLLPQPDRQVLKFNNAAESLFEFDAAEVIGKNISTLMPEPFSTNHDQYLQRYLQTGSRTIIGQIREVEGLTRSNATFPMELSVSKFRGKKSVYFIGILHDMSEKKRQKELIIQARDNLEKTVQERTKQLQEKIKANELATADLQLAAKVFESAGEAILITDDKAIIISVNSAFLEITGYDYEEILGRNPRMTQSGHHDKAFYDAMWNTLNTVGKWKGEIWDRRKNGQIYPKLLTITEARNSKGNVVNYIGIFSDITNVKEVEKKLEQLAYYDTLTKLPNRKLFHVQLDHDLETSKRNKQALTLLFIDLDKFKHVNDTLGHDAGDDLLVQVSCRLQECVRKSDTIARLGGDEFTAILTNIQREDNAANIADKIIKALQKPFNLSGQEAFIGASVGISMFPQDSQDSETLIKHADMAMYQAKHSGRGIFRFFTEEMNASVLQSIKMENDLKKAVTNNELTVFYQAKINSLSQKIVGMEALVRWEHPTDGIIAPNKFIPLAEETGLIVPIGKHVLEKACLQTAQLHTAGFNWLKVAVNLSARQFKQADELIACIKEALAKSSLAPQFLELEVTESMVMGGVEEAIHVMHRIRDLNITIAMDDFGTGYSSLNYLKRFPIQTLKIDRSFIKDIPKSKADMAIVSTIISLAKNLNMEIVSEGVENLEQLTFLNDRNSHIIQGYYFTSPLSFEHFLSFVQSWPNPHGRE